MKPASVSQWYLDNGKKITDARQVANSEGQVRLEVSAAVAQRGDLRIDIAGADGMAIYQPAGDFDACSQQGGSVTDDTL